MRAFPLASHCGGKEYQCRQQNGLEKVSQVVNVSQVVQDGDGMEMMECSDKLFFYDFRKLLVIEQYDSHSSDADSCVSEVEYSSEECASTNDGP